MKKIIVFLLILASSLKVDAQMSLTEKKVSVYSRNNDICELLDCISSKSGVNFTYNSDLLNNTTKTINLTRKNNYYRCNNCEISEVLDDVLPYNLAYTVTGSNIVIYEKQNNKSETINISGNIIDSKNKTALAFATVSINNSFVGTITDENGNFNLKINRKYLTDSITISYLGYYTKTSAIKDIADSNIFELNAKTYALPQIVVSPTKAAEMVKQAANKTNANYDRKQNLYNAFYRESYYSQSAFIARAEADAKILKPAGTDFSKAKISLSNGKKMISKNVPDIFLKLRGGPFNYIDIDFANRNKEFAGANGTKYYDYTYLGIDTIDGRTCNVVEFSKKEKYPMPKYNGKMFIDQKTKAVARMEFSEITDSIVRHAKNKNGDTISINFVKLSYIVNYKFINNVWYLQSSIGIETRKITEKNGLENYITSISQLLITEATGKKYLPKNSQQFYRKDTFWDYLKTR